MAGIVVRRDGAVGHVVFTNPGKFNAMTVQMWDDLPACIAGLDADPDIRVIVLSGDGDKAFVSGADISQFESERSDAAAQQRYVVSGMRPTTHRRGPASRWSRKFAASALPAGLGWRGVATSASAPTTRGIACRRAGSAWVPTRSACAASLI